MPNIKSAKKRVLRTAKETELNNEVYTSMRTAIKRVKKAINKDEALKELTHAFTKIDNAFAKGVIKANARDRYKNRLNKLVNEIK
jgi:small subunit ribosomal protein S20